MSLEYDRLWDLTNEWSCKPYIEKELWKKILNNWGKKNSKSTLFTGLQFFFVGWTKYWLKRPENKLK